MSKRPGPRIPSPGQGPSGAAVEGGKASTGVPLGSTERPRRLRRQGHGRGGWERHPEGADGQGPGTTKETCAPGQGTAKEDGNGPRAPPKGTKQPRRAKTAREPEVAKTVENRQDVRPRARNGRNGCRRRREAETDEKGSAPGRNSTKRVRTAPRVAETAQNGSKRHREPETDENATGSAPWPGRAATPTDARPRPPNGASG